MSVYCNYCVGDINATQAFEHIYLNKEWFNDSLLCPLVISYVYCVN